MKRANIILIILIVLTLTAIAAYFIYGEIQHQNDLKNYPLMYSDLIIQYADEFQLNPYLILSIMRCESSMDPSAVSSKGAIGLMQIMPDTGSWAAHKLGLDSDYDVDRLYDPEWNIRLACWYLNFLKNRIGNNARAVIAAYNAGHGNVQKWLDNPEYSENGQLKVIPFPATEQYYQKVITAYGKYIELYPDCFSFNN